MAWLRLPTSAALALVLCLYAVCSASSAAAQCKLPFGDINNSGTATVVDAQCALLVSLWQLADYLEPAPGCAGLNPLAADLSCSGKVDVVDVNLSIQAVLQGSPPTQLDKNSNGCPDACETCGVGGCTAPWENCLTCPADCGGCSGGCCGVHGPAGCADNDCAVCVCDADPSCCKSPWDAACVEAAASCFPTCGCSAACGNGAVDPGETCDPPSSCPVVCNDGNPCTIDQLVGTSDTCKAQCFASPVTTCGNDACCPVEWCGPADDANCNDAFDYLTYWPSAWASFEAEVWALINAKRTAGTLCGTTAFPPVPALVLNSPLRESARYHSLDMATWPCVQHSSCDNSRTATKRMQDFGFNGMAYGENITVGFPLTPQDAVDNFIESSSHCPSLMSPLYTLGAIGYAKHESAPFKNYVTFTLGRPF
jgi:uncharacterized protein YkwD